MAAERCCFSPRPHLSQQHSFLLFETQLLPLYLFHLPCSHSLLPCSPSLPWQLPCSTWFLLHFCPAVDTCVACPGDFTSNLTFPFILMDESIQRTLCPFLPDLALNVQFWKQTLPENKSTVNPAGTNFQNSLPRPAAVPFPLPFGSCRGTNIPVSEGPVPGTPSARPPAHPVSLQAAPLRPVSAAHLRESVAAASSP